MKPGNEVTIAGLHYLQCKPRPLCCHTTRLSYSILCTSKSRVSRIEPKETAPRQAESAIAML